MDLSIIIVNYNGGDELLSCLRSLEQVRGELKFETIVVDNGSADDSMEKAETRFPWVLGHRAGENLGFAGACNRGLAMAEGRHFMLLNPDTEVQPQALHRLVNALDSHPAWGMVGPRLLDQHRKTYPAARRFPRPFDLFCETTRLAFLFPRTKLFARYLYGDRDRATLDAVDQIEGSALLIRGETCRLIGDLDPRFFIFFEEVDWCKRTHASGFEVHLVQEAEVIHYRSTSMSKSFLRIRQIHAESCMKYFSKHYGEAGLRKVRRWMRLALWIREIGMRLASWLGYGETAKLRAQAARLERYVYARGLIA